MAIIIVDWEKHFENSQSKRWENIRWVPIPNKQGLGYKKIMQQKNGAEIFGCWIAIIECASRQNPRGIIEMSIDDLSLETMISNVTLSKSIEFLQNVLSWVCVHSEPNQSMPTPYHTSPADQRSILFDSIPCSSILSIEKTEFEISFDEFCKMRSRIKKPLTDHAKKLILKKLDEISTDKNIQIKILDQSTANSWQGVFPLSQPKQQGSRFGPQHVSNNELDLWAKDMMETLKD
jgi:hypothetical protein